LRQSGVESAEQGVCRYAVRGTNRTQAKDFQNSFLRAESDNLARARRYLIGKE
jgi:hypothetical protein